MFHGTLTADYTKRENTFFYHGPFKRITLLFALKYKRIILYYSPGEVKAFLKIYLKNGPVFGYIDVFHLAKKLNIF